MFSYLFLIFLPTTQAHEGPQWPIKGIFSYLFLTFLPTTQAHGGPQQQANAGQQKPTAANNGQ
jgi:hypothetical protein